MGQLSQEAKDLARSIHDLEKRMDRLRNLFEMYFQGVERTPPIIERDNLKRLIAELRRTPTRNTAVRFRVEQLIARMNTFDAYWTRLLKQIEEGTYTKNLFMARFRNQRRGKQPEQAMDKEAGDAPPAPAGRPHETGPDGEKLGPERLNAIYKAYLQAKQRCQESTSGITREAVAAALNKQVPAILKQYSCKSVEFKVVIKAGKAIIKAVPKF